MRKIILSITLLVVLWACDERPKDVLSKSKMEQVLYDYHLAQGMIVNLSPDRRKTEAEAYIDAVYEKHGITEAQFDSSMVWYSRHTKEMKDIYDHLHERYKQLDEDMKLKSGSNEIGYAFTEGGDTANIWNGDGLLVLRHGELSNRESFTIKADTSFRRNDRFILFANICFVKENKDDRDCSQVAGLSLRYKDGKSVGTVRQIFYPGSQQLSIEAIKDEDIEEVNIFFYYNGKTDMRNISVVNNIALYRIHTRKKEEPADSVNADSIRVDSMEMRKPVVVADTLHERLTPEELRKQNRSDKKIVIKSRPDVIRHNTVGPVRRRKPVR